MFATQQARPGSAQKTIAISHVPSRKQSATERTQGHASPLQAGSDRVLAAMHRGYTAARYLERLAAARAAMPDLAVTTDIIVGFPGETDDDFERTLEVTAEAGYDSAYTFIYSPRPGTEAAARVDDFVPDEVTRERFERLRVVVERSALARHREYLMLTFSAVIVLIADLDRPGEGLLRVSQQSMLDLQKSMRAMSPATSSPQP